MATVIWFFDQLYVPQELRFDEFAILPLSAEDCALHEAAKDRIEMLGMRGATVYLSAQAVRHGLEAVLRVSFVYPYVVGAIGVGSTLYG